MGLDQFGYGIKTDEHGEHHVELAYWRKHANLQGWMKSLYERRPEHEKQYWCGVLVFNQVPFTLTREDLIALERDYKNLSPAEGFFWGVSNVAHDRETLEFIEKAKKYMDMGYTIRYVSDW